MAWIILRSVRPIAATSGHLCLPLRARASSNKLSSAISHRFSSSIPASSPESQPGSSEAEVPPNKSSENSSKELQGLADQLALRESQLAEYKDLYIRARADYENLQKITTREKAQAKDYAIQSFARDLVSNIDVIKLALESVPEALRTKPTTENPTQSSSESEAKKHLVDLWTGVQSTKTLLEQTLARYGVTPFDPTGQQFDPNKHEAMYQAVVPGKEANSVLSCSKIGWMLRDRVLRPAQVGVAQATDSS